jgi:hypothetical protein
LKFDIPDAGIILKWKISLTGFEGVKTKKQEI